MLRFILFFSFFPCSMFCYVFLNTEVITLVSWIMNHLKNLVKVMTLLPRKMHKCKDPQNGV